MLRGLCLVFVLICVKCPFDVALVLFCFDLFCGVEFVWFVMVLLCLWCVGVCGLCLCCGCCVCVCVCVDMC